MLAQCFPDWEISHLELSGIVCSFVLSIGKYPNINNLNITTMFVAKLCKCNNCEAVLIDQNPQIGANSHPITGGELEMQWTGGLIETQDDDPHWVCPNCMTDAYLVDL